MMNSACFGEKLGASGGAKMVEIIGRVGDICATGYCPARRVAGTVSSPFANYAPDPDLHNHAAASITSPFGAQPFGFARGNELVDR